MKVYAEHLYALLVYGFLACLYGGLLWVACR